MSPTTVVGCATCGDLEAWAEAAGGAWTRTLDAATWCAAAGAGPLPSLAGATLVAAWWCAASVMACFVVGLLALCGRATWRQRSLTAGVHAAAAVAVAVAYRAPPLVRLARAMGGALQTAKRAVRRWRAGSPRILAEWVCLPAPLRNGAEGNSRLVPCSVIGCHAALAHARAPACRTPRPLRFRLLHAPAVVAYEVAGSSVRSAFLALYASDVECRMPPVPMDAYWTVPADGAIVRARWVRRLTGDRVESASLEPCAVDVLRACFGPLQLGAVAPPIAGSASDCAAHRWSLGALRAAFPQLAPPCAPATSPAAVAQMLASSAPTAPAPTPKSSEGPSPSAPASPSASASPSRRGAARAHARMMQKLPPQPTASAGEWILFVGTESRELPVSASRGSTDT